MKQKSTATSQQRVAAINNGIATNGVTSWYYGPKTKQKRVAVTGAREQRGRVVLLLATGQTVFI